MKSCTRIVSCTAVLAMAVCAVQIAGAQQQDYAAIADRLVNQCTTINEGDVVLIGGKDTNLKLLEQVVIEVRKRGAFPLLDITTDNLVRRLYTDVPAKFDTQKPKLGLKLVDLADAIITVDSVEKPDLLANVPPERIAARNKATRPVYEALLKRNVPQVSLGNGLFPTRATAQKLGLALDELTTIFWDGVNVDYLKLQAIGETVKSRLTAGQKLHITHANGTDLTVQIKRRPVHVSDGVISGEDIRTGGPACQVWLPAGEVYFAPVPETAEGTVVIDRHIFRGKEIRKLRMEFRKGRMTSLTAASGLEPLESFYKACGSGKDVFGAIDIGINPNVRTPKDSKMVTWMSSGMISLGVGANIWAGGENESEFGLYTHVPGATLEVDGRPLVKKGELRP